MLYEILYKNNNVQVVDIISICEIARFKSRSNVVSVNIIEPRRVKLDLSSMRKYCRRHQSFEMNTINGERIKFFNIDEFSKLHRVFTSEEVLIYPSRRGREERMVILAVINNGVEEWFSRIKNY